MRRAKLAPGSVPAGSLPTAVSNAVPLCFVCDEPIKSHRLSTSLLSGRTQYTHSPLPTKIGGYIGDEFVVVVTPQDALCKHCMALINTMDRLEFELRQHRYQLIQHLKTKYKLEGYTPKPLNKYEVVGDEEETDEPEVIEVSDEEWTPNKRQRTESTKHHRCNICSASYTNLNLFMAHLSRHKQIEKSKATSSSLLSSAKSSVSSSGDNLGLTSYFKCGCCSESFSSKEFLALHMQQHTGPQAKSKGCNIPSSTVKKLSHERGFSDLDSRSEPQVISSTPLQGSDEQVPQTEIPTSMGVCSEEQKGRVCLLALLNNGVCSDLSHRIPTDTVQCLSDIPESKTERKVDLISDLQTISITVSIPSISNGNQVTEHQLSLPAVPNHSSASNVLYPMTLNSPISFLGTKSPFNSDQQTKSNDSLLKPPCGDLRMNCTSDLADNCLDMPDLSGSVLQDAPQSQEQTEKSVAQLPITSGGSNNTCSSWISSGSVSGISGSTISVQGLDMPSLLDDDLGHTDNVNPKCMAQSSNADNLPSADLKTSLEKFAPTNEVEPSLKCEEHPEEHLKSGNSSGPNSVLSATSSPNLSSVVENIAIVNVASVQVNGDSFDAESIASDWFYSSGKEISSVLLVKNGSEEGPLDSGVWFEQGDNAQKTLHSHSSNTHEFSASHDSISTSQRLPAEDGQCTEECDTKNEMTSFV